jgi:hypothetical protein
MSEKLNVRLGNPATELVKTNELDNTNARNCFINVAHLRRPLIVSVAALRSGRLTSGRVYPDCGADLK